jgi:hypothetical protein
LPCQHPLEVCETSVLNGTRLPVGLHALQTPPLQLPLHGLLQPPQWLRFVLVSTHWFPHCVRFCAHCTAHPPFEQTWPCGHTLPQLPQFALSVLMFAQYGCPPSGWQNVWL